MMEDEEKDEFTKIEGVDWRVIYDWGIYCVLTLIGLIVTGLLLYLIIGGAK